MYNFILNDVIFSDSNNILKTDVVEIDIETKNTKFYMYNKDKNDPIKHLRDVSGLRLASFGYPPSQFKPIITEVSTMILNGQDDKQLILEP